MMIIILIALLIIAFIYSDNVISVSNYTVRSAMLPTAFEGYRIVHLSDLHNKSFGEDNSRLIDEIEAAKPHIIVMTGDMLSRNSHSLHEFLRTAQKLAATYLIYYIAGNHELAFAPDKQRQLYGELTRLGITVLNNNKSTISHYNSSIDLYGLIYPLEYYHSSLKKGPRLSADDIEKLIGKADERRFQLLLAHNPLFFDAYSSWGADLTLCGHIHGGMLRLPGIGGVFSPNHSLFPKYDAGHYSKDGSQMIVSRGLGRGICGLRLFNPADLVVITLSAVEE
jgi:predicted MPP superfamily phosphohydrolase